MAAVSIYQGASSRIGPWLTREPRVPGVRVTKVCGWGVLDRELGLLMRCTKPPKHRGAHYDRVFRRRWGPWLEQTQRGFPPYAMF